METELKTGQIYTSKKPMRWREIRILAIAEGYIVYTYKDAHPFVYTEADFLHLLKDCQYHVS